MFIYKCKIQIKREECKFCKTLPVFVGNTFTMRWHKAACHVQMYFFLVILFVKSSTLPLPLTHTFLFSRISCYRLTPIPPRTERGSHTFGGVVRDQHFTHKEGWAATTVYTCRKMCVYAFMSLNSIFNSVLKRQRIAVSWWTIDPCDRKSLRTACSRNAEKTNVHNWQDIFRFCFIIDALPCRVIWDAHNSSLSPRQNLNHTTALPPRLACLHSSSGSSYNRKIMRALSFNKTRD